MAKFFKTDQRYYTREEVDDLLTAADANQNAAWTSGSITPTAGTGTFTSVSCTRKYKKIGTTVHAHFDTTITTVGTAASTLMVTLPFASVGIAIGYGRETAVNGRMMQGIVTNGSTSLAILDYSNTSNLGSGHRIVFHITYECAP